MLWQLAQLKKKAYMHWNTNTFLATHVLEPEPQCASTKLVSLLVSVQFSSVLSRARLFETT